MLGLAKDLQQEACGDGGADNAGHVGAHGVHQQEVTGVVLLAHHVGNTGSHGNGGDTGRTDQGVDFALGGLAHDQTAQQTTGGGDAEGDDAQQNDGQGLNSQEGGADHGGTDGQGQQDGDDVHQGILHGVAQTVGQTGLLAQVAEHQAADQGSGVGEQQGNKDGDQDGEDDLLSLGDHTGLDHLDLALLRGGHQVHDGGLDQGDQSHVGVSGDRDGTQQLRSQLGGQEDGGGAVCAADDADGGSLGTGEADHQLRSQTEQAVQAVQRDCAEEGDEHAHLSSCAQQQGLGVAEQRTEVGHGTNAHEDQTGVQRGLNADVSDIQQAALTHDGAEAVIHGGVGIHKSGPQLLVVQTAHGQVGQHTAEGDAAHQQGLELLDDTQVQQNAADNDHRQVLPAAITETGGHGGEAGAVPQIQKNFTNIDAHSSPP